MNAERFAQVERVFDQVRGLPPDQQRAALHALCVGQDDVRGAVEGLLKHDAPTPAPLLGRVGEAVAGRDLTGQDIGPYRVERVIGRGGMGVVYLAHDAALHRRVAIKALPAELVNHAGRGERFLREAQLLASLSHPNIATVYGLESCGGGTCLVLELVEGQTLAQRLADGALPIETALEVCRQVAAGVEAAHAAGVIHRDLKPHNVMLTPDGIAKVLDFGLARSIDPQRTGRPATQTLAGVAIGTPGYMSPEQVRGETLDKRADVFALGCTLFECLTGSRVFPHVDSAEAAAAVLEGEPDFSRLPARTPLPVRRLLQRCLAKDRGRRLRDIGDARLELEEALAAREWTIVPPRAAPARRPGWRTWVVPAAVAAAVGGAIALLLSPDRPTPPAPFQRFSVAFPENTEQIDLAHLRLALSRDGGRLVASVTDGKTQSLFLRERERGTFDRIDGTDSAWIPSFSPDGRWVVYFDRGVIRRRPLDGGNPVRVSDVQGYWSGYSWADDGYIAYIPYWGRGVARIHSDGGPVEFLTQPDAARREAAHVSPHLLRDGSALLYTVWDGGSGTRIDAVDLKTRTRRNVVPDGACGKVVDTPSGTFLLWVRAGSIYAAPFDPKTLQRSGPEATIAESVLFDRVLFTACYDVSDDGTLAYIPGPMFVEESRFAWLTPGTDTTTIFNDDRMGLSEPNFSADGKLLSTIVKGDVFKPGLYDLANGVFHRILVDGDCESCAVSPDGRSLAYCSNKDGSYDIYVRSLADESERKVVEVAGDYPSSLNWSQDGKRLAFAAAPDDHSKRDVSVVDVSTGAVTTVCNSKSEERAPRWSPDGRWLAYSSDESGTREVYLRGWPDGRQTRQVTYGGGDWPLWDASGKTLYFRTGNALHAIDIAPDGTTVGRARVRYDRPFGQSNYDATDYAAHPDGRLLLIEPSERGPKVGRIEVLLNWYNLPQLRGGK